MQGVKDAEKAAQIEFWERANKDGFTDADCRKSAQTFRAEFDALDKRLATQPYLFGNELTVLDIAWFIYTNRLALAGYPFAKLHPNVNAWFQKLAARPEFAKEVAMPPEATAHLAEVRQKQAAAGQLLEQVAAF